MVCVSGSLSEIISVSDSLCLSVCLSVYLCQFPLLSHCIILSVLISLSQSLCQCPSPSLLCSFCTLSVFLFLSLRVVSLPHCMSVPQLPSLSVCCSIYLSLSPSQALPWSLLNSLPPYLHCSCLAIYLCILDTLCICLCFSISFFSYFLSSSLTI